MGEKRFFSSNRPSMEKIGIPSRDQYDGIAPPDGVGPASRGHRRYRPTDSTHPESETTNRSPRRVEFAPARNSSPARAPKTRARGPMPRRCPQDRQRKRFFIERPADPQMLAERWRAFYHVAECAHTRSRDRSTKYRYLSDANL